MNLTYLQQACLQIMGVIIDEKKPLQNNYWICVEEDLTQEKRQLLSRMIAALKWPEAQCVIIHNNEEAIKRNDQPIQGIIFSSHSQSLFKTLIQAYNQIIQLPSLATLLVDISAKKAAWQKMQALIQLR